MSTNFFPLDDFITNPPPPASASHSRLRTGRPGRPSYVLDLPRARLLYDLGNSYEQIAQALGVDRKTLYRQLEKAGIPRARRSFTAISDEALDEVVSEISLAHPFIGSVIVSGHLESRGIHLPRLRVQDSLRRVDEIGVLVRWAGIIKRRVYKVRGSNALWHHDGNEKLRPWGFYVHGCVDGHSRLIIYLACCSNKRKMTVANLFQAAVAVFGWPSRMRGDFGTENNEVERLMILYWGILHRAYLRGRSRHNDALETFRQIFDYLEKNDLLDMENPIHSTCLFLVFQRRIQAALDRARDAWNHHRMRTQHDKTPIAIYELSRTAAITRGYWTGDPGDDLNIASDPLYGFDGDATLPPANPDEPVERTEQPTGTEAERAGGILVNGDEDLTAAAELLGDFDCDRDDGNWGIEVYCEAVIIMTSKLGFSA
ncbi:Integrase catalytic domain-containing protein [Favolaschia claudopus]|uniref:Integrase catalytic domain-containing protein n=2 Tax=Favolaschia claudopus TaxID=2862362 RepID=A0AAW0AT27_9AGAR